MNHTSVGFAIMLMAVSLILAGCEYPGLVHALAAPTSTPSSVAEAEPATPVPQEEEQGHEADESQPLQDTVQLSLEDFRLEPNELTAKAGMVTFVLKNAGRYTHDFRVEGQGIDERAPKVGRGREREWLIELAPGTYEISCPISNHASRGMTGTLTVTGASSRGAAERVEDAVAPSAGG